MMDLGELEITPVSFEQLPVCDGLLLPRYKADMNKQMASVKALESRESDIIICAYPKSGTHWVFEIVEQLIAGKAEYSKKLKEDTFLDIVNFEAKRLEDLPSPRNLNTHLPFRMFPGRHTELKAKIIHVMRNPKDVAVSFYHHAQKDPFLCCTSCSWEEFLQRFITNVPFGTWFEYEKEWVQVKKDNPDLNILTIYYENMKLNIAKEITNIAEFLGVNYTNDLIQGIAEKVEFRNITKATVDASQRISIDKKGFIYRKGEVGDWKNWFTVAQNEMFDLLYEKEMKDVDLNFRFS